MDEVMMTGPVSAPAAQHVDPYDTGLALPDDDETDLDFALEGIARAFSEEHTCRVQMSRYATRQGGGRYDLNRTRALKEVEAMRQSR